MRYPSTAEECILINIDYPDIRDHEAQAMLALAQEYGVGVKVGTELTTHNSWVQILQEVGRHDIGVFADTKADDIPRTVEATLGTIFAFQPKMVNIHASAGEVSLARFLETRQKMQSVARERGLGSLTIAVTILTSKSDREIRDEFNGRTRKQQSRFYAHKAADFNFDGITCSGDELKMFQRDRTTRDLAKVVLGVRPAWSEANDQRYVITPGEAIRRGATFLGIGRPITRPPTKIGSSHNALESILEEVDEALPSAA